MTSIYWYFRKEDELLDAMTDRALARYEFTVADDIDFDYILDSILDHAAELISLSTARP